MQPCLIALHAVKAFYLMLDGVELYSLWMDDCHPLEHLHGAGHGLVGPHHGLAIVHEILDGLTWQRKENFKIGMARVWAKILGRRANLASKLPQPKQNTMKKSMEHCWARDPLELAVLVTNRQEVTMDLRWILKHVTLKAVIEKPDLPRCETPDRTEDKRM
eukprot:g22677.t1